MEITLITGSNDPYATHFTEIARLMKRGLAMFRDRKEGHKIVVCDMEHDMTLTVEETDNNE